MLLRFTFALVVHLAVSPFVLAENSLEPVYLDGETDQPAAVVVHDGPLVHTGSLLPIDPSGKLVAEGDLHGQFRYVLQQLQTVLVAADSRLEEMVRLDVVAASPKMVQALESNLSKFLGEKRKVVTTFVAGDLPRKGILVAIDAVAISSFDSKDKVRIVTHPEVFHEPGQSHAAILPRGEKIYLSGWIHRDGKKLSEIVDSTLQYQISQLERLGSKPENVVQIRAFLDMSTQRSVVEQSVARLFQEQSAVPPVVYVPWGREGAPEIEFVVAGRSEEAEQKRPAVEYFNMPGRPASPVFSRAARINSDKLIYVSGMVARKGGTAEEQVQQIFEDMETALAACDSDLKHLVKATYFLADSEASKALTQVRLALFDPKKPPAASGFTAQSVGYAERAANIDMIAVPRTKEKSLDLDFHRVEPTPPEAAVETFKLRTGFRIELVASEPLLRDPVAIDFDENGRMFIAEFSQYNERYAGDESKAMGAIKMLEDTNGDGLFDKSTAYVESISYPSAVTCYDGGVFVAAAPDIFYYKDTNGDGKADLQKTIYTGFGNDPSRAGYASLNSFRWGLDNRFHVSSNLSGGKVRLASDEASKSVNVRNRNFIFDPRSFQYEATSGGGQHGLTMDDWGRELICQSSKPFLLLMYDDRYLARNPLLKAPGPAVDILTGGKYTPLFSISPEEQWRVARTQMRAAGLAPGSVEGGTSSGYFTAATGLTLYRGDAWPASYRNQPFIGEVAGNLIFQAKLEPNGVGLIASRAGPDVEFAASTDNWFRPVQFANAPDGNLYVLDMYRELVEGAAFLPPEVLAKIDVLGGQGLGRVYRIVSEDFQQKPLPQLGRATTLQLVALLEHRNGWHRDTASRLLYTRQDQEAVEPLRQLATASALPEGRVHAIHALEGLNALDERALLKALSDSHPRVRENAVKLGEQFTQASEAIRQRLAELANDSDIRVRYQVAFSLGSFEGPTSHRALLELAKRDAADSWFRLAILSSVGKDRAGFFRLALGSADFLATQQNQLLVELASQIGRSGDAKGIKLVVQAIEHLAETNAGLAKKLVRGFLTNASSGVVSKILATEGWMGRSIQDLVQAADKVANDTDRKATERVRAIRLLRLAEFSRVESLVPNLFEVQQPQSIQIAAVDLLVRFHEPEVATLVLGNWPGFSPKIRRHAFEVLTSRAPWLDALLNAVEKKQIHAGEIGPAQVQMLLAHPTETIRQRAAQLFESLDANQRQEVVQSYQPALQMAGDVVRGKEQFRKVCSACHRLEAVGNYVGADLKTAVGRGTAAIMLNILDPNREVKPKYLTYVLITEDGRSLTGMIQNESINSITLRRSDNSTVVVLRKDIEELQSTGFSFMPEGLEKQLSVEAMADLLAYLNSIK